MTPEQPSPDGPRGRVSNITCCLALALFLAASWTGIFALIVLLSRGGCHP
jgi:hypothetical protein